MSICHWIRHIQREQLPMRGLTWSFTVMALLLLSGCERWALDRQMEELCAKDGGIKVYEKVRDPKMEFSNGAPFYRHTSPNWPQDEYFGPDYRYVTEEKYIVGNRQTKVEHGEGNLVRIHTAIYRRTDNKLLGEQIWYHRAGGDGFVWGGLGLHPSGKNCPMFDTSLGLQVFKKGE